MDRIVGVKFLSNFFLEIQIKIKFIDAPNNADNIGTVS
jgi:hypothetical protein